MNKTEETEVLKEQQVGSIINTIKVPAIFMIGSFKFEFFTILGMSEPNGHITSIN